MTSTHERPRDQHEIGTSFNEIRWRGKIALRRALDDSFISTLRERGASDDVIRAAAHAFVDVALEIPESFLAEAAAKEE